MNNKQSNNNNKDTLLSVLTHRVGIDSRLTRSIYPSLLLPFHVYFISYIYIYIYILFTCLGSYFRFLRSLLPSFLPSFPPSTVKRAERPSAPYRVPEPIATR
eukprot:GHVU01108623.1.p1 GENE.GHVU01108623.1~~GHVU01108623.1.p1  ORF type:complete len:102 (+),score=3.85 GHVU01108623.1:284-589(+)